MADDLMVMMGPCRESIQLASQGTTTMGVWSLSVDFAVSWHSSGNGWVGKSCIWFPAWLVVWFMISFKKQVHIWKDYIMHIELMFSSLLYYSVSSILKHCSSPGTWEFRRWKWLRSCPRKAGKPSSVWLILGSRAGRAWRFKVSFTESLSGVTL